MKLRARTSTAAAVAALSLLLLTKAVPEPLTVEGAEHADAPPFEAQPFYSTQNREGEDVKVFPVGEGRYQDEQGYAVDERGNPLASAGPVLTQHVPREDGGSGLDEWRPGDDRDESEYSAGDLTPHGHGVNDSEWPGNGHGGGFYRQSRLSMPGGGPTGGRQQWEVRGIGEHYPMRRQRAPANTAAIETAMARGGERCNIESPLEAPTFEVGELATYISPLWIAKSVRAIYKTSTARKLFFKALPFSRKWKELKADWEARRCNRELGQETMSELLNAMYPGDELLPTLTNLVSIALEYQFWGFGRSRKCLKPFFAGLRNSRKFCDRKSDFWQYIKQVPMCDGVRWDFCKTHTTTIV